MGRWFPDIRKGTAEQVAAYREAQRNLNRNAVYEHGAGIREETPQYERLNREANRTAEPLNPVQRFWHFQRAGMETDREFSQRQRAAGRSGRSR